MNGKHNNNNNKNHFDFLISPIEHINTFKVEQIDIGSISLEIYINVTVNTFTIYPNVINTKITLYMLDSNRISTYTHKQMIEIKNRLGEIAIIDGTEKQLIITKDLFISGFKCGRDRSKKNDKFLKSSQ